MSEARKSLSVDVRAIVLGAPRFAAAGIVAPEDPASAPGGATASMLVAGDLCVAADVPLPANGAPHPWSQLIDEVRSHDLALVNLECPLTRRARPIAKAGPVLWGDPELAKLIAAGGFTGVTLANNHVLDAGADGVRETLAECRAVGLLSVGAGEDLAAAEAPLITDAGGLRVGVVACAEREFSIAGEGSPGAAPLDPWRLPGLVRDTAESADVVVVIVHGGNEFAALPRPGLVVACRALVSAGAHAVICHHSHVAGPMEVFGGSPIFYGVGNFLFPDDVPDGGWHRGYAVSLTLAEGGVRAVRVIPYDQCADGLSVRPLDEVQERAFVATMLRGAAAVADPRLLASAWDAQCEEQNGHYLYMALGLTRPERRLVRYGRWPSWRRSRRRLPELLHVLTCDSHREALEHILRKETRG